MRLQDGTVVLPDGFRVGVTHGGSGIPLVFLHGLSVSAGAYGELLELLAANGFQVWALDLPDHGRSDSLPWGHTIKDMARIVQLAMDHLGVYEAIMVGHSMGGGVTVEFASCFPGRVKQAILLDPAAGAEHHKGVALTPGPTMPVRAARFFAGAFRDVAGDARRAGEIRRFHEALSLINRLGQSVSGASCLRAVLALMKSNTAESLRWMRACGVSTVIVHGDLDGIIPVEAAVSAAELAGGMLWVLEDEYHSWMISDPVMALAIISLSVGLGEVA